jgi:hypothetical protein
MMMKEIWHMTLDNMARKVTADFDIDGPSYTNASVSRSALPSPSIPVGPSPRFSGPVSPRFSSPPSPLITVAMTLTSQTRSLTKEMLQTKIERDLHRKLFRLSTDENLINRMIASTRIAPPPLGVLKSQWRKCGGYRVPGHGVDDVILPPRVPFDHTQFCLLSF